MKYRKKDIEAVQLKPGCGDELFKLIGRCDWDHKPKSSYADNCELIVKECKKTIAATEKELELEDKRVSELLEEYPERGELVTNGREFGSYKDFPT